MHGGNSRIIAWRQIHGLPASLWAPIFAQAAADTQSISRPCVPGGIFPGAVTHSETLLTRPAVEVRGGRRLQRGDRAALSCIHRSAPSDRRALGELDHGIERGGRYGRRRVRPCVRHPKGLILPPQVSALPCRGGVWGDGPSWSLSGLADMAGSGPTTRSARGCGTAVSQTVRPPGQRTSCGGAVAHGPSPTYKNSSGASATRPRKHRAAAERAIPRKRVAELPGRT